MVSRWATPRLAQYVPERWGDRGRLWLGALDERVDHLIASLHLVKVRVHPNSNRSLVLRAKYGHEDVAVKLDPDPQAARAFAALDRWASFGVAPAPVCKPAADIDVRRWVAGPSALQAIGAGVSPLTVTASVFTALSHPTGPVPGVDSQRSRVLAEAEQAIARLGSMEGSVRREVGAVVGGAASEAWLRRQVDVIDPLTGGSTLCHGDLTPNNVLWVGGRAVLIDAEPMTGSLVVDAGRWVVRTHVTTGADAASLMASAKLAAGVDEEAVLEVVRFGAVTYAVYLATFARAVDPQLRELVLRGRLPS